MRSSLTRFIPDRFTLPAMAAAVFLTGLLAAPVSVAFAQSATTNAANAATASEAPMADGEIRKIDKAAGKLTIKHGEIKNLDMPPMTMVFQVRDKAMLEQVKKGDKVRFHAIDENGKMVVTEIISVM